MHDLLTYDSGGQDLPLREWRFATSVVIEWHQDILGTDQADGGRTAWFRKDPHLPAEQERHRITKGHLEVYELPGRLADHRSQLGQTEST